MKKKRIGFIGAGRVTKHHIDLLKKLSAYFKIEAVCDYRGRYCSNRS